MPYALIFFVTPPLLHLICFSVPSPCVSLQTNRGVHPPETMMHFPLFQISPYFRKIFWTLRKIFAILLFPDKFLDFHPPKFLMTFLVIDHKFRISPLFSLFQYISLGKLLFPLLWQNFPPCFTQIHLLFTYFTCISFPHCFDHDAFKHHPMHVLDASACIVKPSTATMFLKSEFEAVGLQTIKRIRSISYRSCLF